MKTRVETRTRQVLHTIDGIPELVDDEYDVIVPVPPRDWDHIVITSVLGIAGAMVAISVVWSTASIGDFLARAVVAPIAYLGAVAFGLAWISCMALEWHARYDPARARLPCTAGNIALLIEMGAVCAHGSVEDSLAVGVAGAVISAVAKGMWTVTLEHQARPMSPLTQKWFLKREEQMTARIALAARQRQLDRTEQHAAALPQPAAAEEPADRAPAPGRAAGTVRSAVRAVLSTTPDASADDVLDRLDDLGIDYDERTVRTLVDSAKDTGPDTTDSRSDTTLRPISPPGQTVTDTIRTALSSGFEDKAAVLSYVQKIHGPDVDPDNVRRIRSREMARRTA
ncbi:protein transporter Sec31 [Streptomyces sp. ISL-98]|uniref:protein transporter Sec31 n=1 Tax=Streptomyces sp. ISL-98 TaxID=2819192 RepID=UPI001BEAFDB6|nr:protein transporter Sec31 [Streptomyces sp. ISL-98]MBT2508835.1 protein transporter Sec31 [Streptomyces sp. ISL-98]